jgi:hypothetical protein
MASPLSESLDKSLDKLAGNWPRESFIGSDGFIILEVGLGVGICALLWALFLRRRKRKRRASRSTSRGSVDSGSELSPNHISNQSEASQPTRRQRRRRRHRRKNPTLAETGGLPPARADRTGTHSA